MDVPVIDFYHVWCILSLENWQQRKKDGILQVFRKLKDEGLIRHICVSSHMTKGGIRELLMEGVFEGGLFGYSAYNFNTRQEAFDAIKQKNLGAVVMNPLGGGIIPQHPELFGFLQRSGETVTAAALRFLWDHPEITSTLVGFGTLQHVKQALAAMDGYKPRTQKELEATKAKASVSLDGICTGCSYCDNCPQEIPVPKYMEAYNHKIIGISGDKDPIGERLFWHWKLEKTIAGKCTGCGLCEKACTQHLSIIDRLKEISGGKE